MQSTNFAVRLKEARIRSGLSKADLSEQLGFASRSAATKWEKGDGMPDVAVLPRLAVVLGTTTDYLLGVDLMREETPHQPVDLAAAASGDIPLSWSGRPLTGVDRRRAFAVLHGLLAPVGEISHTVKELSGQNAKPTRNRAEVVANVPAKRPRTKGTMRGEGGAGQPLGGSDR